MRKSEYLDEPGIVIFKDMDDNILYILRCYSSVRTGLSSFKHNIKRGYNFNKNNKSQEELFTYLQQNPYKIVPKYLPKEEVVQVANDFIFAFTPKFNQRKINNNITTKDHNEYMKEYYRSNEEQRLKKNERSKKYYYEHIEYFRNYQKKRNGRNETDK